MTNRLAGSSSPYLLQHADDPVDWDLWSEEAFARARELDRPVLLSCGYSACHWCHVMQRESFRDPETAALINERFVAVKVDRELRPDIDALYQDYVSASAGSGGWPLTVFLTPGKLPLFGGTYFPARAPRGQISLADALTAVSDAWRNDRRDVEHTAAASLAFLREQAAPHGAQSVDRMVVDAAVEELLHLYDQDHGGFGGAPKFPPFAAVEFLAAYASLTPDSSVLRAIHGTLRAIMRGGIFDQVGGGVHRYATDDAWRVPHFEKMLYDQGGLLIALAAAAGVPRVDGSTVVEYAAAARATTAFLRREMTLSEGGLAASLSAESNGVEGAYYVWTHDELAAVLTTGELACAETELGAEPNGSSRAVTLARAAGRARDAEAVDAVLAKLAAARASRQRPARDGKRLASWNAIAARGLIASGRAFAEPEAVDEGVAVARLLVARAMRPDGVLREPDDASVAHVRLLEDAAHLVALLLDAHDATGDGALLEGAAALHADTLNRFGEGDAFYATAAETDLPVRPLDGGDAAIPSGTSTTIDNAVRLGTLTGDASHFAYARAALAQRWPVIDFAPEQSGRALLAAVRLEIAARG